MQSQFKSFTALRESGRTKAAEGSSGRLFKNVTLIKSGLGNAVDRNYYRPQALKTAVDSQMFEGLRAYADHPDALAEKTQPERSIRDIVGVYKNSRFVEDQYGARVVADLHLLRTAGWLGDMVEDLQQLGLSDRVGISINGRGATTPRVMQTSEAKDGHMTVHDVTRFVDLKSADIVTEAGAGGGFPQLLESARKAQEKRMTKKEVDALQEAAAKGDADALAKLVAAIAVVADEPAAEADADADPVEEGKKPPFKKKGGKAEDAADGGDDEDEEDDTEEAAKPAKKPAAKACKETEEAAIEAAAEKVVTSADAEVDTEEADADEGDAAEEVLAAEATPVKKPAAKGHAPSASLAEANVAIADLQRRLSKSEQRNGRLAEALKVRQNTDRARKLLKESGIPSDLQPDLLTRMVGLSEESMQAEVRFTKKLLENAKGGIETDNFEEVEGQPSRVRESFSKDEGESSDEMLKSVGLPLLKK